MAAVSAMKCTPQKTVMLRRGGGGLPGQPQGVAHEVGHVLHLGPLVVVSEDDGALLFGETADLGLHR